MQWPDFVFSNRPRHRFLRHTLFWVAWWLYFYVIYWYNQHISGHSPHAFTKLGSHIFLKSLISMFLHAAACYTFIYLLVVLVTHHISQCNYH